MKIGDVVSARVDNKTEQGLLVEGTVSALNSAENMVQIDTQFGIRIWVPEADVKPIDG